MAGTGSIHVTAVRPVGDINLTHQYDVDVRFDIAFDWGGMNLNGAYFEISCDGQMKSGSATFNVSSGGGSWIWANIGGTKTFRITMPESGVGKKIPLSGYINTGVSPAQITASGTYTLGAVTWEHTVTFNANGGTGAPDKQKKVYGSNLTLSSVIPTKPGYIFMGWATSSAGDVAYAAGGSYVTDSDITLYAVWKIAYIQPSISSLKAERCTSAGVISNDGTYIKVSGTWAVDKTINSGNKATNLKIEYRISTSNTWTTAVSTNPAAASGTINSVVGGGNISTGGVYFVRVTVTDSGGNRPETAIVAAQFRPVDVGNKGHTVSFGAAASDKEGVEFHTPVRLYKGSAVLDIYDMLPVPIGAILHTEKVYETSPAEDYPWTTWERIKGKVLVGVDEADTDFGAVGETGGEKTHKLTVTEIPNHSHTHQSSSRDSGTDWIGGAGTAKHGTLSTSKVGGDQPHNNLQPYRTVYMWKRIS